MSHRCFPSRTILRLATACALGIRAAGAQAPALPPAPGEFDDGKFTAFSFFAENDVIPQLGRNKDRNYTGGFAFQASGSFVRRAHLDAPLVFIDRLSLSLIHI